MCYQDISFSILSSTQVHFLIIDNVGNFSWFTCIQIHPHFTSVNNIVLVFLIHDATVALQPLIHPCLFVKIVQNRTKKGRAYLYSIAYTV